MVLAAQERPPYTAVDAVVVGRVGEADLIPACLGHGAWLGGLRLCGVSIAGLGEGVQFMGVP